MEYVSPYDFEISSSFHYNCLKSAVIKIFKVSVGAIEIDCNNN